MFMLVSIKIMIMNCLQGQTLAFIVSWMLAKVTWLTGQKHKGFIIIGSKKKGPLALCLHLFALKSKPHRWHKWPGWMLWILGVCISTNECSKKNLQTSVVSRYTHTQNISTHDTYKQDKFVYYTTHSKNINFGKDLLVFDGSNT